LIRQDVNGRFGKDCHKTYGKTCHHRVCLVVKQRDFVPDHNSDIHKPRIDAGKEYDKPNICVYQPFYHALEPLSAQARRLEPKYKEYDRERQHRYKRFEP
jgi:hypothetical protein